MENLASFLGANCEIKSMQNRWIGSGHFTDITEDDELVITSNDSDLPILSVDTVVKISISHKDKGLAIVSGSVFVSNNSFVKITDARFLASYEKREYFRLLLSLPAKVHYYYYDIENNIVDKNPNKFYNVEIIDLSLGGMLFKTTKEFIKNDVVVVLFQAKANQLAFPCQIRRVNEKNNEFFCGCEYLEIDNRKLDILYKYLFEKQAEQIRKQKNFIKNN